MGPFYAGRRFLTSNGKGLSPHWQIVQEEYQGAEIENWPKNKVKEGRDAKTR